MEKVLEYGVVLVVFKNTNEGATLYVDSSLLETYKEYRDTNGGKYKILPLQQ